VTDAPKVFAVRQGVAVVDAVAHELLRRHGDDPLALARVTVLLPTRRGCRSLREAFLRLAGGRPILLPRIAPIGDLDADDALTPGASDMPEPAAAAELPPAIPDLRRKLLLARLILAKDRPSVGPDQAAWLAGDLARLLDQLQTERLSFDGFDGLVPGDLAEHWQQTLEFLRIVRERWPDLLSAEAALDPAERRNLALEAQAAAWAAAPPADPVIAAGSTGSIPATAGLLAAIAGLPAGAVVLPGLDRELDDESWDALDDGHPQFAMARLLARLGLDRRAVADWPLPPAEGPRPDRRRLVRETMRPPATTEAWRAVDDLGPLATAGLTRIDCPTPREEAGVAALLMREALEVPGKTVALVTPDRGLARRVAAELRRWHLQVDDSAGRPLADTAVGGYLRLAAACALEQAAPVALLSLLKHPLAAGGRRLGAFRREVRALERAVLRGPRPAPGFAGLKAALLALARDGEGAGATCARLTAWLTGIERLAGGFFARVGTEASLADLLHAHIGFAEALAATDEAPGAERLWRHDDGEAAAALVDELRDAAADFPVVAAGRWPALFEALMAGRAVRPAWGDHPRLFVWGPLEARLQQADRLILGGLNEGVWPPDPAADPWLSRPMRAALGLPPPERRIGLSAHDFAQALAAPEVFLTRAARVEGAPTVPSRWLQRLDAVLDAAGERLAAGEPYLHWQQRLDRPAAVTPCGPPAPRPPPAARPRGLSVTEIGTWMTDPYAIYARRVLRLEKLDPIDADPGAAERGMIVHDALKAFFDECLHGLPPEPLERLMLAGAEAFARIDAFPGVRVFWWSRFQRIAQWIVAEEMRREGHARPIAGEVPGRLELAGRAGPFALRARADRVDRLTGGGLAIVDYKTGGVPSGKEVERGFAPQLPLEAAIARAGGFEGVPAAPVEELAFWRLGGGDPPGEAKSLKEPATLVEQALDGLKRLIDEFDDPATAYLSQPRAGRPPRFTDYAHLARVEEWAVAGPDGTGTNG
jgi:ATP-dependent helicase/nuclease subunit B